MVDRGDLKFDKSKSGNISNPDFLKVRYQMGHSGFSYGYSFSTNHWNTRPFKIQMFLSKFQIVFHKMAAICPDF